LIDRRPVLLNAALGRAPVVALVGPRQVGKTTLARQLAGVRALPEARFFDLERATDRAALSDPDAMLAHRPSGPGPGDFRRSSVRAILISGAAKSTSEYPKLHSILSPPVT